MDDDKANESAILGTMRQSALCATCRKPVRSYRKGSFTGWIFQSSSCTCISSSTDPKPRTPRMFRLGADSDSGSGSVQNGVITDPGIPVTTDEPLPDFGPRYDVERLIGSGGMGSVYQVKDIVLEKTLAIKILKPELVSDAAAIGRFKQEAQAAATLTHANLVPVYGQGEMKDGSPYIIMDYIEGVNLGDILWLDRRMELDRALKIFLQVAEVLTYAHSKGVVHRDLKPSNIMICQTPGGEDLVRLVDFGIAKLLYAPTESVSGLTQTGDVLGSPVYMSPEQCQGSKLDERSDVYSFGCVMFETLTGSPPFSARNPVSLMMEHIQKTPPIFKDVNKNVNVPIDLETIVLRCLEKQPQERYQSFEDISHDLTAIADGKDLSSSRRQTAPWYRRAAANSVDALIIGIIGAAIYTTLFLMVSPMVTPAENENYFDVLTRILPASIVGGFTLGALQSGFGFAPLWLLYDIAFCHNHVILLAVYSRLSACLIILVSWLYFAGFESSRWRATIGERLLGLMTVDARRRKISFSEATFRWWLKSVMLLQPIPLLTFIAASYALHLGTGLSIPQWLKESPWMFGLVCIIHLVLIIGYLVSAKKSTGDSLPAFLVDTWDELISQTRLVKIPARVAMQHLNAIVVK